MFKIILLITIIFTVCSCIEIETKNEIRTLQRLIKQSNERVIARGFILLGYGGKWNPTIQLIDMSYTTTEYKFKSVEEARNFFLPFFEEYIKPFNEEKSIRPYLMNFPLDARNLELSITFKENATQSLLAPWINRISTCNGKIIYRIKTSNHSQSTVLYSEPYEEALKIVSQELKKPHGV